MKFSPLLISLTSILWGIVQLGGKAYAQDSTCVSCLPQCLCQQEIGTRFQEEKKEVIRANWDDFAGENLEVPFPASVGSDIVSLRLDALGCVYPSFINDSRLRDLFLKDWVSYRALASRSFYILLRNKPKALDAIRPDLKTQFVDLARIAGRRFSGNKNTINDLTINNFFEFRKAWNQLFLTEFIHTAQQQINEKGIRHLYFFIPGYNVPYSLAHLQGNRAFEDIDRLIPTAENKEKVMFIRLFWPSNNQKNKIFGETRCNMKNQKSLRNGLLNDYVTNRAYLASLTLRAFLKELDPDLSVHMISHSFGAVISTGVVLSPKHKIKASAHNTPFNKRIIEKFKADPPGQKITLFLNAPAIPGTNSFLPLDKIKNANHHFYIGYNPKDQMLSKQVVPVIGWFTSAARRNATTLGANWRGEVDSVKVLVAKQGLDNNFTYCPSLHKNHDYFCYREQQAFKSHFSNYITRTVSGRN